MLKFSTAMDARSTVGVLYLIKSYKSELFNHLRYCIIMPVAW